MKTYRLGFLLSLIGNIVLTVALVGLWLHYRAAKPMAGAETKTANSTAQDSMASSMPTPPASTEAPLVPMQISPQRLQSIGVKIGKVERKSVADEIRTTGSVAVDERRLAYVQVRFSGYIQKVFADATYQYVRKGQPLFTVYSPELVATEREYLVAKQNQQQVAQSTVQGVALSAAWLLDAAAERLKQWGVPQKEVTRLESTGQVQQELEVDSPVSGYITERNALPGVAVQPEMRLYTIADLSTVWVQAQVFQNDLERIKIGAPATLTVNTYPGRTFAGRVDFIYPQVDMDTRTAKVRVVFSNPGLQLKPGMFVNVSLKVSMGIQLVIPARGSFVPPPPGAGAASTTNAPQGNVELSSDPTPPRKGSNVFHVKLTDASGAPISGAEVSVTFLMPAMPAMGMAAMRIPVTLSDKANGLYEGSGQLESGGTWQVTVLAKKNGQLIATKQLSVNATGGM